jgi:type IV secretory pathway VirJ component
VHNILSMKKLVLCCSLLTLYIYQSFALSTDSVSFGAFGKIYIYKPTGDPTSVVLFVSGDGGWNSGVVDMAKNIMAQGALVAGIDIQKFYGKLRKLTSKCFYPASDFEQLSMMLQKKYKFGQYKKPVLIGYSSGATLVYGILLQAPANTFKGAISLGFCPDIEINKPLCTGSGLKQHVLKEGISYYLEASEKLTAPFIVLQGMKDQVCSYVSTQKYMEEVKMGELITLPKVGHGFSVAANWLPQFKEAYKKIFQAPSYTEQKAAQNSLLQAQHLEPLPGDFPVTLIPTSIKDSLPMVFLISGDGGWTSFDQAMAETFADKGMPVVGLDAQKYFWNRKTPEETTIEVTKAIEHYLKQWKKEEFILAGYSFGACIVPYIAARLPVSLKETLKGVFSLSPEVTADFEIHISDMLSLGNTDDTFNVISEIKKIKSLNPVCIFGEEESEDLRSTFSDSGVKVLIIPGDHHYNNNPASVVEKILNMCTENNFRSN